MNNIMEAINSSFLPMVLGFLWHNPEVVISACLILYGVDLIRYPKPCIPPVLYDVVDQQPKADNEKAEDLQDACFVNPGCSDFTLTPDEIKDHYER